MNKNKLNIGIQTWGSNGDIRPMIALGGELAKNGHNVTICIFSVDNKDYSELCNKYNLKYIKIPKNNTLSFNDLLQKIGGNKNSITLLNILLKKLFFPFQNEMYENSCELANNNDLLIGHFLLYPLKIAAKKYNIRHISVLFWPGFIKTKYDVPYPLPNTIPAINLIFWKLFDGIFNFILRDEINKLYFRELGIKIKSALNEGCLSDDLNLIAASSHLWKEYDDWNGKQKIMGSLEIEAENDLNYENEEKINSFIIPILIKAHSFDIQKGNRKACPYKVLLVLKNNYFD